ncbi:MAG: LruC domain-containing protein [Saprospiraceae bacterium]|nr:LruC domain-containing protein [Saprospiraceae bacterium]
MKNLYKNLFLLIILLSFVSCKKDILQDNNNSNTVAVVESISIDDLIVADDFDYKMSNEIDLRIKVLDLDDQPIKHILIKVYSKDPAEGGELISKGQTLENGEFNVRLPLATYKDNLYIAAYAVGMINTKTINVQANGINEVIFGGKPANRTFRTASPDRPQSSSRSTSSSPVYNYMGSYDTQGLPYYLTTPDQIDATLTSDINASLPENAPVPVYNPDYLVTGNNTTIELDAEADVWVTFVHEGAGYRNSLAYYTYDPTSPPTSSSDIDTIHIIFPNMSFVGSGGNMLPGDKVYLGTFPAGTGIGWSLIANGWRSYSQSVGPGYNIFYSAKDLNPEAFASNRQHNVILNDVNRDLLLIGFEDIHREQNSDEDFNDAVFYTTVNPKSAISNLSNFRPVTNTAPDADSDGVPDYNDDYPNDPDRAFNKFYPSENSYGTLVFEDLWPDKGDYDCNDLVVDYRFMHVTNADNEVLEMYNTLIVKAIGAAQHNGLGFELGITPSEVQSVTGSKMYRDYITLGGNGCETGQSNAVFFAFDDPHVQMSPPVGFTVNTETDQVYITPDTTNLVITLTDPVDENTLSLPPYNPFLVKNRVRGVEIHLVDYAPTDLADLTLFGMGDDDSDDASSRYYKTINNLPWALHFPDGFDYPIEEASITQAYIYFAAWAQSSGAVYTDWYTNIQGYRQTTEIYQ